MAPVLEPSAIVVLGKGRGVPGNSLMAVLPALSKQGTEFAKNRCFLFWIAIMGSLKKQDGETVCVARVPEKVLADSSDKLSYLPWLLFARPS